jgi:hypothetical protein
MGYINIKKLKTKAIFALLPLFRRKKFTTLPKWIGAHLTNNMPFIPSNYYFDGICMTLDFDVLINNTRV